MKGSLSRYRKYLQTIRQEPLWQASFVVIMSLVLVIVLILAALKPTLVTIAGLVGQIDQQKKIEARMDEKIAEIQKASEQLQRYQNKLPILSEALPLGPNWSSFAETVTQVASQSGIEIRSLTLGPIDETGVNFNVNATGSYPSLRKFVTAVNNLRRIAVISNISFSQENNEKATLSVKGAAEYRSGKGEK